MGYILLLIHFSMLYHDTYITSPFIIIFCCSILKKSFSRMSTAYKEIRTRRYSLSISSGESPAIRTISAMEKPFSFSLRAISKRPSKRPSAQPVHGYHFPQYGRYNGPPPYHKRYGHPQTGEPWRQGGQDG